MGRKYTVHQKHASKKIIPRLVLFLVLLVSSGFLVAFNLQALQSVGKKATLFVESFFPTSADNLSADVVLRGTIYDRSFKEMAVSYQLFSLYAHPRELTKTDKEKAASLLAGILEEAEEILAAQLKSTQLIVELAANLDSEQVREIEQANLSGIYCKQKEARFYPYHEAASMVLGFVDKGVGLAGIEGSFDTVLQPGQFKRESAPGIDFGDQEVLGKKTADLILTLDLDLQKKLQGSLQAYLAEHNIEKGVGFIVEPFTGRVLAAANQPSFNPNYFWQYNEEKRKDLLYKYSFKKQLIDQLLVKAAAIHTGGLSGELLPQTIAAPEYGLGKEVIQAFEEKIKLRHPVSNTIQILPYNLENKDNLTSYELEGSITPAQIGVALSSLVNGGWRIAPNFIEGIYDHHTMRQFIGDKDKLEKHHVLDPATGVVVRKKLLQPPKQKKKKKKQEQFVEYTFSYNQVEQNKGLSQYVMQDLYLGFTQPDRPKYLVVIAVERNNLAPMTKGKKRTLSAIGQSVLGEVKILPEVKNLAMPEGKSEDNYRRFLIGKRLDYKEAESEVAKAETVMPEVKGLSLRKALQRLNQHEISIRVNGTGIIIAQNPSPGEPIHSIKECTLTLASEI